LLMCSGDLLLLLLQYFNLLCNCKLFHCAAASACVSIG
jgi:hypothetical protein